MDLLLCLRNLIRCLPKAVCTSLPTLRHKRKNQSIFLVEFPRSVSRLPRLLRIFAVIILRLFVLTASLVVMPAALYAQDVDRWEYQYGGQTYNSLAEAEAAMRDDPSIVDAWRVGSDTPRGRTDLFEYKYAAVCLLYTSDAADE